MPIVTIRLPDIGEGIAQAELVGWCVAIGEIVAEDAPLAEVMTDKATVEIPSAVSGRVVWLGGEVGDTLAIGCDLMRIEVAEDAGQVAAPPDQPQADTPPPVAIPAPPPEVRTPLTGTRRVIAERMEAAAKVPQFTLVEEVDVTSLLAARDALNTRHPENDRLTVLPFVIRAVVAALADFPAINSHLVDGGTEIVGFQPVHCGIATQTPNGLMVPVLREAQTLDLGQIAAGIARLAHACRTSTIARGDLSGSTITITSLGALGGISTTPILNLPEVAIIGINRISTRPVWDGTGFVPGQMMNLSSSFDHRVIDGWLAASFVGKLKELLETISFDG